jgi:hypothetical protein
LVVESSNVNKFEVFVLDYLGPRGNDFPNTKDYSKMKLLFMFLGSDAGRPEGLSEPADPGLEGRAAV